MPLGVLETMEPTPGVWPSKEELSGGHFDTLPPPELQSTDNYFSANMHITTLEETFIEERSMGMCDGPFTLQEAANLCRCRTDEIICGALGAVEEADKVRTIYDGTVGGQNGRIQHHIKETTTSPTVQDAMHAIHWCRQNTQS